MKSDCCGVRVLYDGDGHPYCERCNEDCPQKLTPEQIKAIRWPTADICDGESYLIKSGAAEDTKEFAHWAIRYALQDLIPSEDPEGL